MAAQVKVILHEDVIGLGEAGSLVAVKSGYARNYLLPQAKAVLATEGRVKEIEHHKQVIEEKISREHKEHTKVRNALQSLALEIEVEAGEEGKLFGSVTAQNVCDLLAEKGHKLDRRKIALEHPIKEVGEHSISIKLWRDITADVKLKVVAAS